MSWFWRGWYLNNWSLDLAIERVIYDADGPTQGARLMMRNLDRPVLPATVEIEFDDGSRQRLRVPAETWLLRDEAAIHVDATKRIKSVTIDPDHDIPDRDRSNNVLRLGSRQ